MRAGVRRRRERFACAFARELQDRGFGRGVRIVDAHVQQETIELRFGQRIGAFLLDRVLRRHDEEQRRQRIRVAADRDLPLAHRFEHRRLHLRRRAVDFVGEDQVVEDRAALELEGRRLRAVDLGAGEVGRQQVRRELHAVEIAFDARGELLDRGGLGEAGRAFDQQVAVGEQRDQQAIDQRFLADDALAELGAERGKGRGGRGGFWHVHGLFGGFAAMIARPDGAAPTRGCGHQTAGRAGSLPGRRGVRSAVQRFGQRDRLADQPALRVAAAEPVQDLALLALLDAFGDEVAVERARHRDDDADHRDAARPVERARRSSGRA